jgi:predicted ATPase
VPAGWRRAGHDWRAAHATRSGGIGKTRLGVQVAAELIDDFPDGVYFVDLAPIRESALVISAIAQTLGMRETGGQPLVSQLKQFLGNKSLLLQVAGPDGAPRFVMLETIREYVLERLEASGKAEWLRQQHARYYLTLGDWDLRNRGPQSPAQLEHLDRDYDNFWSALAWSQT